jgi:hypothetical protein
MAAKKKSGATPSEAEPRIIDSYDAFTQHLQLAAVRFMKASVTVIDQPTTGAESGRGEAIPLQVTSGTASNQLGWRVSLSTEFEGVDAAFSVEVAALYVAEAPMTITPECAADVIERSTLLTLGPYLREGLMSLATRVGVEVPFIPLIGPGARTGILTRNTDPDD